ncbi:fad binding domain containing protein [Lichtheimia corymbifera JMRC:FSU:9682]|uniref:Fad binding domain containing protein n=1 Tax=Lichtheimia corymbifera JMRC:FSU:9682 TaxID=1263082 RepID=A0A068RF55_9FUNG|nr:fad binding domain containing protein [Lichtheimia corymbifera JMRC:FSU:9682]
MTTTTTENQVLIIGGGLAGLALGNVLQHHGVPYTVFERESSPNDRLQGWSLSMHFVLPKLAELIDPAKWAEFGPRTAVNPQDPHNVSFAMVDGVSGKPFMQRGGPNLGAGVYRVNRKRLRDWLSEDINVVWGKQFDHYVTEEQQDGGVKAVFKDGTEVRGRLLIGVDGSNSAVAQQKLGTKLYDEITSTHPVKALGTQTIIDAELRKKIEEISSAFMMAFGQNPPSGGTMPCVFSSLNDVLSDNEFSMQWSVSTMDEDFKIADTDAERLQQAKDLVRKGNFTGPLAEMIFNTKDDSPTLGLRIRERAPLENLGSVSPDNVILVGDAAHAMTMFRGEGANHAIMDSLVLGEQLIKLYKDEISLKEALDVYYKEMIPRGRKAVQESHEAAFTVHKSREAMEEMVQSVIKRHSGASQKE